MFMMIFYISRVTDLTYAKSAPGSAWCRSNAATTTDNNADGNGNHKKNTDHDNSDDPGS